MHIVQPEVECVYAAEDYLGESPLWSADEQAIYWINCEQPPLLHRLDPQTGEHRSWPMPERIGAVALQRGGGMLVALASGVHDFNPDSGVLSRRTETGLPSQFALHEGKCDRVGRFWIGSLNRNFTSKGELGGGAFQRLAPSGLIPVINDVTVANGLAWSPDGKTMYLTDTLTGIVRAYDYRPEDGSVRNCREFISISRDEGFADGAAVDSEGGYWITLFKGGCLRRYLPDGTLDLEIKLPFSQPTMLAFGGVLLDSIYVTSGCLRVDGEASAQEASLLGGGLFRFKTNFRGLAEPLFDGSLPFSS